MRILRAAALVLGCMLALGSNPAFGNLIVNGDFESGGVGFGTQYQVAFSNMGQPGQMTLTSAPSSWNTSFANPAASGLMLVASGSTNVNDAVWMSALSVTQGATYQVSFKAASLSAASPANLRFYVSPDPLDPVGKVFVAGVQLGAPSAWSTASGSFTASQTGTVSVFIHNLVTASNSNDFAIDNITVVPEPSSLALLGIGSVVGLGVYVRRRRRSA